MIGFIDDQYPVLIIIKKGRRHLMVKIMTKFLNIVECKQLVMRDPFYPIV